MPPTLRVGIRGAQTRALCLLWAIAGCGHDLTGRSLALDETDAFDGPVGFSADDLRRAVLAPDAFVRRAANLAADRAGLVVGARFGDGFVLTPAGEPGASLTLIPEHAAGSPARLRQDSALVAFDDAYPQVGAAWSAADGRAQLTLRIPSAAQLPRLRFQVTTGPRVARWESFDGGLLLIDAAEVARLQLPAPRVRSADGRVVTGRWQLADGVLEAELPAEATQAPALVFLSWEEPRWSPAAGNGAPSPRADAGMAFYAGDQNCLVVFGGYEVRNGAVQQRGDLLVRCEGRWQTLVPTGDSPTPRQGARLAYAPLGGNPGMYLFGGLDQTTHDELWRLTLTGSGSSRKATWNLLHKTGAWPAARYEAGMAFTGGELLLFGGFDGSHILQDTWRWNGVTWKQLPCAGETCFPARRSFTPFTVGGKAYAFGGFAVVGSPPVAVYSNALHGFTAASGWSKQTVLPAPWPTLPDGTLDFDGESLPVVRDAVWAAEAPSGGALIGSGETGAVAHTDVWRLQPLGAKWRWSRVAVTDGLPGPRVSGSAAFDPTRGETVIVGGLATVPSDGPPTQNQAAPLAYRHRVDLAGMKVSCHAPTPDAACDRYTIDLRVIVTDPQRLEARFSRLVGAAWTDMPDLCDDSPDAAGEIHCEIDADDQDGGFAVQLRDPLCLPDEQCAPSLYSRVLACSPLPFADGQAVDCH
jgi:hypothetical protein